MLKVSLIAAVVLVVILVRVVIVKNRKNMHHSRPLPQSGLMCKHQSRFARVIFFIQFTVLIIQSLLSIKRCKVILLC